MRTFTIDEIREALTLDTSVKTLKELGDTFRSHMEQAETAELMYTIIQKMNEVTAADPVEKAAADSMNQLERIMFFVREAFVCGELWGYQTTAEVLAATIDELDTDKE